MKPIKRKLIYIFKDTVLRLRIRWESENSITLSTGYHVDRNSKGKTKWDGQRCKHNTFHGKNKIPASTINKALEEFEERINQVFYHYESLDKIPTPTDFK